MNSTDSPELLWTQIGRSTAHAQTCGSDVLVSAGRWLQLLSVNNPQNPKHFFVEAGVQVATAHRKLPCIAYAEQSARPHVVVLANPGWKVLQTICELEESTYLALEFGELELLVGLRRRLGVTDIIIWNWRAGEVVSQFPSAIQAFGHSSLRVSCTTPLRVAEWNSERMHVWLAPSCYKTSMQTVQSFELSHVLAPMNFAWTEEGLHFAVDSKGKLFLADWENSSLDLEVSPALPLVASPNVPPPCLAPYSGGWALSAGGSLRLLKKRGTDWVTVWAYSKQDIGHLVVLPGVREMLLAWTMENTLISFKGEKTVEVVSVLEFGCGLSKACIIHPDDQSFLMYDDVREEICLRMVGDCHKVNVEKYPAVGIIDMASSPWQALVVVTFQSGCVRFLEFSPAKEYDTHLTNNPIDSVRFTATRSNIVAVASRQMGEVFLLEIGRIEPAGFLRVDTEITDYFIEKIDGAITLVTLAWDNILRRYKLEGRSFAKIREKTLSDCIHQILPHAAGVLTVSPSSASLILLSTEFEIILKFETSHILTPIFAKQYNDFLLTFSPEGRTLAHKFDKKHEEFLLWSGFSEDRSVENVLLARENLLVFGKDSTLVCYNTRLELHGSDKNSICHDFSWKPINDAAKTWLQKVEEQKKQEVIIAYADKRASIVADLALVKNGICKLLDSNQSANQEAKLVVSEFELNLSGRLEMEKEHEKIKMAENELQLSRIRLQDDLASRIVKFTQDSILTPSSEVWPISPSSCIPHVRSYAVLKSAVEDEWTKKRVADQKPPLGLPKTSSPENAPRVLDSLPYKSTSTHLFVDRNQQNSEVRTVFESAEVLWEGQEAVLQLMEYFNIKFTDLVDEKLKEMEKLRGRKDRLASLSSELEELGATRPDVEDGIEPKWHDGEFPETILSVAENELLTAVYRSPAEEEALLEAAAEAETRRRLLLADDDFRKRALLQMMDGVLHNPWQNQIKRDIPIPTFMTEKDPSSWTEDEIRKAKAYRAASEKLNVERERFEKLLITEYKQLIKTNKDAAAKFDEKVKSLSELKLRVESAICQEQLIVLLMKQHGLKRAILQSKKKAIKSAIAGETKKLEKLGAQVGKLQQVLADARSAAEISLTRDKNFEKNFRKDFPEFSTIICEQLHKLAKKRPKLFGPCSSNPSLLNELGRWCTQIDCPSGLPLPPECAEYMKGLEALDSLVNCPAVVNESAWEKLVRGRRIKIDSELKTQALFMEVSQTEQAIASWQRQLKSTKEAVAKKQNELEAVQGEMRMSESDYWVQMVVPQGLVEVPTSGHISDFSDAVLLPRSVVDQLNNEIIKLGQRKIEALQSASKDKITYKVLHKEWEQEMLRLRVQELKAQQEAIQHYHVTRELQNILAARSKGTFLEKGFNHLENQIRAVQLRYEKEEKRLLNSLEDYEKKIIGFDMENAELSKKIVSLQSTIERKSLDRVSKVGETSAAADSRERMNRIFKRSRLKAKSKELENEISALQAERDVLLLRVHPTLIQN